MQLVQCVSEALCCWQPAGRQRSDLSFVTAALLLKGYTVASSLLALVQDLPLSHGLVCPAQASSPH